jgi:hypothetical protein
MDVALSRSPWKEVLRPILTDELQALALSIHVVQRVVGRGAIVALLCWYPVTLCPVVVDS